MKPFIINRASKILSIGLCLFALSACETVEGIKQDIANIDFSDFTPSVSESNNSDQAAYLVDGNCPTVQIVSDLGTLNEFPPKNSMKASNLISSVKMNEANSTCSFNDRSVTVDLKLAFEGMLGPKGRSSAKEKPFFSYPFFVAVTSSSGKILAKEIFAASMTYEAGQNEQLYFETLRQIIPADTQAQGASYKVMVGFQLTKDQLNYNRKLIEEERIAAEKAEKARIEAEKAAMKAAKEAEKEAAKASKEMTKENMETSAAQATEKENSFSPFDIFKTNDQ